ncbi:type 1 glutamine amidotransferase family protein [Halobacillus sp. ACCC02827]|uniref:type 1 glutamine amidotransferase family protein n=1 Tax=Halobacillus sp. ACCC02827 TaxID=3052090 RepID=UPI0025705153|nr:type 1 glutamine amidotransferase family protein [Halobacillus sp. ACCC02827]WJE17027.1 type 1 glutamine amidotransferase family protein [Halobacillus sp. ACCC02827]
MKTVLVFVTDGYADWEVGYITAELNKPGTGYSIETMGIDKEPKVSMGGMTVLPDYQLGERLDPSPAMVIFPGGTGWREEKNQQAEALVRSCLDLDVPVAAICDAATFLGRHGFLDNRKHTGNSLAYLKEGAAAYEGDSLYIEAQSVRSSGLITANGSAALEFSRDILTELNVMDERGREEWYGFFKEGFLPN